MKIEFNVHPDNVVEFAEILTVNEMVNKITGITDEGTILIDVHYCKSDRDVIEELEDFADSDD